MTKAETEFPGNKMKHQAQMSIEIFQSDLIEQKQKKQKGKEYLRIKVFWRLEL